MNPNLLVIKKGHCRFFSERKTVRENFKMGVNTTFILCLLFIGFLGIFYVWTLNVNATSGYNIRKLEIAKNNLEVEKELLEVKVAEIESLSNLTKWDGIKDMKQVDDVKYIVVKNLKEYAFNE